MKSPALQVCPICAYDDDVTLTSAGGEWIFTCSSRAHPPYEWRPTPSPGSGGAVTYRSGLGQELGVYDDLKACVIDGWSEYGIVEYRYAELAPDAYRELLDRYGHRSIKPKPYTASAFLGGALGQLWREGAILGKWAPATAYWSYNGQVGTYAPLGTPEHSQVRSWHDFAIEIAVEPMSWPPTA